jgi:hypothetical protein
MSNFELSRELLVAGIDLSGSFYSKVAEDLNDAREEQARFEVVPKKELYERAADFLTDERIEAAQQSLAYRGSPPLVLPKPNPADGISHTEIIQAWANARYGRLNRWLGRQAFLENWSADELSGRDPSDNEPVSFIIAEMYYDEEREGPYEEQLAGLRSVQADHSQVHSMSLFEGAILANLVKDLRRPDPHAANVYPIELNPTNKTLPWAEVNESGYADICEASIELETDVSRRSVR